MKAKNILDGSPYRLDWLVWIRGTPGVVIVVAALAILAAFIGWHFFNLHAEAERLNTVEKSVAQSAAQLAITRPAAPIVIQEKTSSYQESVASDHPKAVRKIGKHYSVEVKNEDGAATETTTQDEQEIAVKSDSSVDATGEAPAAKPVDYWSSVNGYVKAVDNQSKKNDEIIKELNGGE